MLAFPPPSSGILPYVQISLTPGKPFRQVGTRKEVVYSVLFCCDVTGPDLPNLRRQHIRI